MDSMGGGSDNQPKRTQRSEVATLATDDLLIGRKYGDIERYHSDLMAIGYASHCIQKAIYPCRVAYACVGLTIH